jgi:FKBP-type peptidyl-prolyl cis-trans isomerase FkpA
MYERELSRTDSSTSEPNDRDQAAFVLLDSLMQSVLLCTLLATIVAIAGCAGSRPKLFGGKSKTAATVADKSGDADFPEQMVSHSEPTQAELSNAGPFASTSTGLSYRVLRAGQGPKPRSIDRVRVHYHGWLDDGTVFDSSYQRGAPTSFRLDQVVPGWTEGLQYVSEGGKIELEIPSHLGYGGKSAGKIPPHSKLHFVVELLAINP